MTLKSYEKKNGIRKKENSFVEDLNIQRSLQALIKKRGWVGA